MLRLAVLAVAITLGALVSAPASAMQRGPTGRPPQPQPGASGGRNAEQRAADSEGEATPKSDAERSARLQRIIEENRKLLEAHRATLNDPESEYENAQAAFKPLNDERDEKRKRLQKLNEEGPTAQAEALEQELIDLETRWKLAKDRYELALAERKTLLEQTKTLEQKIKQDEEALKRLTTPVETAPPTPATAEPAPSAPAAAGTTPPVPADSTAVPPAPAPAESPPPPAMPPMGPTLPAPAATPPATEPPPATPAKPPSKELIKAKEEAQAAASVAEQAEQEVRSIAERITGLEKDVQLTRDLLRTARLKADNARDTERALNDLLQKQTSEGAPLTSVQETWAQITAARERLREAQAEVSKHVDRVDQLQDELRQLQAEEIAALQESELRRVEAEEALRRVAEYENPLSPRNIWQWTLAHIPKVIGIVLTMLVLLWLVRLLDLRIVSMMVSRADHGTSVERENRAKTLASVLHNAANLVIIAGGSLMLLTEIGLNIVPLMGGVAVVGLAVAFGAQNLIRDYFYGFMMLLENQYGINDVIKIGDKAGLVERITMRITVLRDLEGVVHFIPNGQISSVSNMTHGWSRALFEIRVSYKEDVDQVMQVLTELGQQMRKDPQFSHVILDDPEMLGVDSLGESSVNVKFFIKTRPLEQWTVKRALLRRIKHKFDELGIEIPFPHRMLYHRFEDGTAEHLRLHSNADGESAYSG